MRSIKRIVTLFSCLLITGASGVFAQTNARAMGMGLAYTAVARGVYAPAWNPANLGLPDNPSSSFSFFSISAGVGNNSFTKDLYDKYFVEGADENNKIYWNSDDVNAILSSIPDNGFVGHVLTNIQFLSFSVGRFALTFRAYGSMFTRLSREYFEIPLVGNKMNQIYNMSKTKAAGMGLGIVSFSYGHPIKVNFAKAFSVGASFKMLYGLGYANSDKASMILETAPYGFNLHGAYEATVAVGGLGWGLDLGTAAKLNKKWDFSLSLSNALGNISWKDPKTELGYFNGDSLYVLSFDDSDENSTDDSSWSVDKERFSNKSPSVLRFGVAYKESDFIITADYLQSFHDNAFFSIQPRFVFGTEWRKLGFFPLRMGVGVGGRLGTTLSFGFGLHLGSFKFDVGIMNRGFINPNTSKGFTFAVDMSIIPSEKNNVTKSGWR